MTHPPRLLTRALAVLLSTGTLALMPSATHAVAPVAGAQTSGDVLFPNVGNGGYDVGHYDIDLVWTAPTIPGLTADSIDAVTTITAATTDAPLSSFSLDLEGLMVGSVTVDGVLAAHARVTDAGAVKHKLVVTPVTPVDGTFTTVVTYSGTPTSHTDADGSSEGWGRTSDGVIFLNQPVGSMTAFPNNNTPSDKATYDVSLDIPSTILGSAAAAVSNGELVSKAVTGARTTWTWRQEEQMASMAMLISIGRYTTYESDIPLASGRVLKEYSFIDPTATGAAGAETARANLKSYLDFFESRYGTYPGNSTGIVVDNISLASGINYALETQDRAFFPNSVGTSTNIHETMHQWWGDGVSPEVWNDIWISEGAASFAEVLYPNEGADPPTSSTTTENANYSLWSSTAPGSANWTVPPAAMTDSADLFGWQTYNRSEMTFEALKTAIGTADFDTVMSEWNGRYNGQSPGTAAFIALAEEVDGRELDGFFADWIYEPDKPAWPSKFDLAIASTPSAGAALPGTDVSYAVTVTNTGKVPVEGAVVTVDVAGVLDDAAIDEGALPAGASLGGTTVTWAVPTTPAPGTTTLTFVATVEPTVADGNLVATTVASSSTLGSTCTSCSATLPAGPAEIAPSAVPTIDDTTPQVGQAVSASTGTWADGTTFAYEWLRGDTPVPGATSSSYAVGPADLASVLSVRVTGTKTGFQATVRTSAATSAVAPGDQTLTPTPTITGTPKVGSVLTAAPGTWDAGVTVVYQWKADDLPIAGATSTTYQPVVADLGTAITVAVTGTKAGYTPVTRTSAPTAAVAGADQTSTPAPTVAGTPRVGETLTAAAGSWDPGVALSYQWLGDGTVIPGATSPTYALVAGDLGKSMS
jgi:hypothetical protein